MHKLQALATYEFNTLLGSTFPTSLIVYLVYQKQ